MKGRLRVNQGHIHSGTSSHSTLPDGRCMYTWRCRCGEVRCKMANAEKPTGWAVWDDPNQLKLFTS